METPDIRRIDHWGTLGQTIKDARVDAGLTQHQLAEQAGVSRAWLARVESGHRKAEVEYLMRALAAVGLTLAVTPVADDGDPEFDEAMRRAGLS